MFCWGLSSKLLDALPEQKIANDDENYYDNDTLTDKYIKTRQTVKTTWNF